MPGAPPANSFLPMDSSQTLHDFVLNLLTNAEARSAFELDPEGVLNDAGLGDITAADVQDVVPLVVDYAPVQGITSLAPVQDLGVGALDSDPANVIGQLQAVTSQLTAGVQSTSADANVAAIGAIAVDSTGLDAVTTSVLPGLGLTASTSGAAADLSGVHDVADTLDADVVSPVTADATGTVDATLGTATGLLSGSPVDGVLGTTDATLGTVTGTLDHATGLVDGLGLPVDVPDVSSVTGDSSLVGGATGSVTGALDGVGVGGLLSGDASVHGSADASAHTDTGLLGATDILF
jgi:hypothetical protein